MSNIVIFDLEATCWDTKTATELFKQQHEMEIIEIGAVAIDKSTYDIISTFQTFVKPVLNPILSDYCKNLTSITSKDISTGLPFTEAYTNFMAWANNPQQFIGWGYYDYNQIKKDREP